MMKALVMILIFSPALAFPGVAKPTAPLVNQISRFRFEVSRKALEHDLPDPSAQLDTFTASPSFATGWLSGLKVSDFTKKCLLPRFGLQNGDVVEMVNGQPLTSLTEIMEVGEKLAQARAGTKVRINIRRGKTDIINSYLIVE